MANLPDIPVPRKGDPDGNYDTLAAIRAILTEHALAGAGASVSQRVEALEGAPPPSTLVHDHGDVASGGNALLVPTIADLSNAAHSHQDTPGGGILAAPGITSFANAQHDHADAAGGGNALIVPTIASFANAQHDHSDAAGGGTLASNILDSTAVVNSKNTTGVWYTFTIPAGTLSADGEAIRAFFVYAKTGANAQINVQVRTGTTPTVRATLDLTSAPTWPTTDGHINIVLVWRSDTTAQLFVVIDSNNTILRLFNVTITTDTNFAIAQTFDLNISSINASDSADRQVVILEHLA